MKDAKAKYIVDKANRGEKWSIAEEKEAKVSILYDSCSEGMFRSFKIIFQWIWRTERDS